MPEWFMWLFYVTSQLDSKEINREENGYLLKSHDLIPFKLGLIHTSIPGGGYELQSPTEELLEPSLVATCKTHSLGLDVQRIAIKCLGLFGLLEKKPSEELVRQLKIAFCRSPPPISIMASKALVDLGMWQSPTEVDKAMGQDLLSQFEDVSIDFVPVDLSNAKEDLNINILDLQYAELESDDWRAYTESSEDESVKATVGEGFSKLLLLGEKYPKVPNMPASFYPFVLGKLIALYFSEESKEQLRFKQCLSVFFEHYASLLEKHKVTKTMRSLSARGL